MSNAEIILITGGTGKVGRRIAAQLRDSGVTPRVATRQVRRPGEVRFDWADPGSFDAALRGVGTVYLVAPPSTAGGTLAAMRPFLDHAMSRGVGRFVLQSASALEAGGPMMGAVHTYLRAHAPRWAVLRPTWFMQNFSEQQHLPTIRDEGAIYSATGDGRVAFIAAEDIAAVAARALTEPAFPDRDLVLTGPQPLSYDEVAAVVAGVIGRPVVHRRLQESELACRFAQGGMDAAHARTLAAMDTAIARGSEDRVTDGVRAVTGRSPGDFRAFAEANADVWRARPE